MKKPLRIAILEADTPLPEVVEQFGRYDRIFSTLIEAAAEGEGMDPKKDLVLKGYDVVDKMDYPDLNDWDAILISGSSMFFSSPNLQVLLNLLFRTQLLRQ